MLVESMRIVRGSEVYVLSRRGQREESFRRFHRQRPKQQDINERKHRRRRTNAEREREESRRGECPFSQQPSEAEAYVLHQRFDVKTYAHLRLRLAIDRLGRSTGDRRCPDLCCVTGSTRLTR